MKLFSSFIKESLLDDFDKLVISDYLIAKEHILDESTTTDHNIGFSVQQLLEQKGDPIDDQWIQDEKPVMTKDGRQVIITSIDYKEIPNVIKGQVKMNSKLFDYEWDDTGMCIKSLDRMGNPKKSDESDNLVKAN